MTKPRSLSRQIALTTAGISTAVILFTSLTFSMAYYFLVQHDTQTLLASEASEILQNEIAYTNGQITYHKSPPGETLATKLQTFNLSAVILDPRLQPVATFGIFQGLSEGKNYADYASAKAISDALTSDKTDLATHTVPGNLTYETLISPIASGSRTVGVLILSLPYEYVNHLLAVNLIVLAFALPLSLLFGWVLSVTSIRSAFAPLNQLVEYIKGVQFSTQISGLEFKRPPSREISALTEAFNDMISRVGSSLEKQKDFIAHASHELKTPLTQAVSSLDLAATTDHLAEAQAHVSRVKDDLLSLNHILDSLLTMSKIGSTLAPSPPVRFLVRPAVTQILTPYKSFLLEKKLHLAVNIPGSAELTFSPEHFRILVGNLVNNAIKYNVPGGKLTLAWSGHTLTVSDSGIGMTPDEKVHMFDRFYRGRHQTAATKGTGLGLALVKLIADQNHLTLAVTSAPHRGTRVDVAFPA